MENVANILKKYFLLINIFNCTKNAFLEYYFNYIMNEKSTSAPYV